ncbi:putative bifunctional diguanylate cyclase/phosphodiesterase [Thalassorhabdomicrobium marinisediminis]|uniref:GGDEF-domain containing protein n=1 Tax=Thalassorhabdomicrobium marinisediminis TaxID=2170577 RepID=A0A2T7FXD7_9RHOB|nr:bifunctional diguanylate cyclase/phosphodiesterase [Thalassorhabdomicrobium marinisediminis]PVA06827.1 hypothetical protein DC363_06610 [Thalassorhabdomicrobium marinisediminis]
MIDRFIAQARRQLGTFAQHPGRDIPLQLGSAYLICLFCGYIGHPYLALFVAVSVTGMEYLLSRSTSALPRTDGEAGTGRTCAVLALCAVTTVLYLLPALTFTSDPSLAIKMTGMTWVMGTQVYLVSTLNKVPAFLAAKMLPAMGTTVLAFVFLAQSDPAPSGGDEWAVAAVFLLLFLVTALDLLRLQGAADAQIAAAQGDAAARLACLEEAQRLDPLTGLLNRNAFDLALQVMLDDRADVGGDVAVFLVDLNSFKPINDTYSHAAGDEVLLQTAQRLRRHVRDDGIVGRLGGDEFVCAVTGLDGDSDVIDYATALEAELSGAVVWNARRLKVGASIGVAMTGPGADHPAATVTALCTAADRAMFAAKNAPQGGPCLYRAHLFAARMTAEDKRFLVEAISNRRVKPYYQPKVHLGTGRIVGFEALARWEHPDGKTCIPSNFIEQIEELGLQGDFMTSMATQVIEDIATLLDEGHDPGQVSLNITEVTLATHSGRGDLQQLVQTHPQVAPHLTFEITEDVFIARAAEAIQTSIKAFRALGVRISLDDFGTGFASFHHLRQLDFDELKIDTSFVDGLGRDPTSEVLVQGFLDIASGLGVSVVAEGVETEAQRRDLINMGCLTAQGYLFSEAVPLATAADLLGADQQPQPRTTHG